MYIFFINLYYIFIMKWQKRKKKKKKKANDWRKNVIGRIQLYFDDNNCTKAHVDNQEIDIYIYGMDIWHGIAKTNTLAQPHFYSLKRNERSDERTGEKNSS